MNATQEELDTLQITQSELNTCLKVLASVVCNHNKAPATCLVSSIWKRFFWDVRIINNNTQAKNKERKRRKLLHVSNEITFVCYMCRQDLPISQFPDPKRQMCNPCFQLNEEKRHQTADLKGKIAIVTGCRVKIGFHITLKLLRAHCTVVGTTRFPQDALRRYQSETDFLVWSERLWIADVDFLSCKQVNTFCDTLLARFSSIDILINNAAETIARPSAFYQNELALEQKMADTTSLEPRFLHGKCESSNNDDDIRLLATDDAQKEYFPVGHVDVDGQQVDLRKTNSWVQRTEDVTLEEFLHKQVINCTVPFLLIKRLTPLLTKYEDSDEQYSFIVNVSAMEGVFAMKHKTRSACGKQRCQSRFKHDYTNRSITLFE